MTHNGAFSSASLGRLSRLERLGSGTTLNLLAMDHAVTEGWYEGQDQVARIAQDCFAAGINGVVCHRGMVRLLPPAARRAVFLQLYGSAILGTPKAQLLQAEQALTLDCVGVSIELDADGDANRLSSAFGVVEQSQRLGLLALLMVGYSGDRPVDMARALAIATQVGPDFVKTRITVGPTVERDQTLRKAIDQAPPLLMAGGKSDDEFEARLSLAKALGFRGTCVGRSYFQPDGRDRHIKQVIAAFSV